MTAQYDGKGRRIKKVVTNSGQHDGTELYFYDGWKVIEVRDGSENVIQQAIHGKRYIDDVVALILEDGVAFVHQDANWNVVALTDFAGRVLERYKYTPYGQVTVDQETYFGDYDGDGFITLAEVDTNTNGSLGTGDTCWGANPSGACRVLDFDFDDDVDAADKTVFDALVSAATYRQPGRTFSALGNTRFHQGLIFDPEIGSYNNRRRQYAPQLKQSMQRDPLAFLHGARINRHYHDGMNLYEYVSSSPLMRRDPNGTDDSAEEDAIKADDDWGADLVCLSDVFHCGFCLINRKPNCKCYREVKPGGTPSKHKCFEDCDDDGDGDADERCKFESHEDQFGCCVDRWSNGDCFFNLCFCVVHLLVDLP